MLFGEGCLTSKKGLKNRKYEKVSKGIRGIEPYKSTTKEDILDCLGHEDAIQKILGSLGNRKDADQIFISAILKSWKFWVCIFAVPIAISCLISYLFLRFPSQTTHAIEKTINAKIPDLLPIRPHH